MVKYFDLTPFIPMINQGTNVIAIMLQNTWQPTWDNIAFDIALRAIPQPINLQSEEIEAGEIKTLAESE